MYLHSHKETSGRRVCCSVACAEVLDARQSAPLKDLHLKGLKVPNHSLQG